MRLMLGENVNLKNVDVKRGRVYMCNFGEGCDSEQGGVRPALVIKNQKGCDNGTIVTVVPITSKLNKGKNLPTHISIGEESGLLMPSELMVEQIKTISKSRLIFNGITKEIGKAPEYIMEQVQTAFLKDNGFISLYFDEIKAFKLLKILSEIIKLNTPRLKKYVLDELRQYCGIYNKDYKKVCEQYNKIVLAKKAS